MNWLWAALRAMLDLLGVLKIYQQDKQEKVIAAKQEIIKEGRDAEKKVLADFGAELEHDAKSLGLVRDNPEDPGGAAPE